MSRRAQQVRNLRAANAKLVEEAISDGRIVASSTNRWLNDLNHDAQASDRLARLPRRTRQGRATAKASAERISDAQWTDLLDLLNLEGTATADDVITAVTALTTTEDEEIEVDEDSEPAAQAQARREATARWLR